MEERNRFIQNLNQKVKNLQILIISLSHDKQKISFKFIIDQNGNSLIYFQQASLFCYLISCLFYLDNRNYKMKNMRK